MSVESTPYLELMPADAADAGFLRRALGTFATGVTVVTVGGPDPHGMTANSFTAVSLRPPLVLVCINQQAQMHERMGHGSFGVSVLSSRQEAVARYFADLRRPLGTAQFEEVEYELGPLTGAPLLKGAVAHFECQLAHAIDGGDHTIFVGRLLALGWEPEDHRTDDALLFVRGRFHRLGPTAGPAATAG